MSKTICIGDLHGRSDWKIAVYQENPNRVIFIGDYFDSFTMSAVEQIDNFKQIIKYKEDNPQIEVIMLIGNHCHHYFPEVGYTGTSGYQFKVSPSITQVIDENRHHLQMAYGFNDYLFTHAGVSPVFMDQVFGKDDHYEGENWRKDNIVLELNELFKYKPRAFDFNGLESTGDNVTQTPIWIRPRSLMHANKTHPKGLKKDYIQIVGHTQMKRLDLTGSDKFTGGRYYFIDTMDTSGQYLVIEDDKMRTGSVR